MSIGTQSVAVTVDQEVGRREELTAQYYTGMQFLEDMGAGVFGKCNGENVLAILLLYRVGGSVWGVDETVINQTSFHAAPYDRRKIEDNDFVSHRVDPIYRSDDFTITREPDRVIWQAGSRQVIARPPFWDIKGEHAGVDVDITMEQSGDADWLVGPWEKLGDEGRAGRDLFATATGRITALGKTYQLEPKSMAINEHVVFGERWVGDAQSYTPQYFYHLFRNDEMQIFVYVRPDSGVIYGRVVLADGREIRYDWDDVSVEEGEYWLDPKTHMRPPVTFRLNLDSPHGSVEVYLTAYSRSLYTYSMGYGERFHYSFFVHSIGRFVAPDGKATLIADGPDDLCFAEWGLTTPLGTGAPLAPAQQSALATRIGS